MPPGPWLFPEDQLTDAPLASGRRRDYPGEALHAPARRASLCLTVEATDWKELNDRSVRIEQTIYVERDSQKKIVLGAKGATIKEISMSARQEIGEQ